MKTLAFLSLITGIPSVMTPRMFDPKDSSREIWPDPLALVDASQLEAAFLCGLAYTQRDQHLELLAAPVLLEERYRGQAIYFSDIIVRADSPYHSFQDLRGRESLLESH